MSENLFTSFFKTHIVDGSKFVTLFLERRVRLKLFVCVI